MRDSNAEATKAGLAVLKQLEHATSELRQPPAVGIASRTQPVLTISVVEDTRGYLEATTHQINGTYENGWYDACAVMMRKLLETLIIEVFEQHGMAVKIQTSAGDFEQLATLVGKVTSESHWNLSRTTKRVLFDVKQLGDNSAHGRRFTAHRGDIDGLRVGFRTAVQELVQLCGWP